MTWRAWALNIVSFCASSPCATAWPPKPITAQFKCYFIGIILSVRYTGGSQPPPTYSIVHHHNCLSESLLSAATSARTERPDTGCSAVQVGPVLLAVGTDWLRDLCPCPGPTCPFGLTDQHQQEWHKSEDASVTSTSVCVTSISWPGPQPAYRM